MVVMGEIPSKEQREDQREEVNWAPRSDVRRAGTPKRETQERQKAEAQSEAVVEDKGTTSTQRVVRSTMVKRWVKP